MSVVVGYVSCGLVKGLPPFPLEPSDDAGEERRQEHPKSDLGFDQHRAASHGGSLTLCCAAESGGSWGKGWGGGGCGGGTPQVRGTMVLPALADQDGDCSGVSPGTLE